MTVNQNYFLHGIPPIPLHSPRVRKVPWGNIYYKTLKKDMLVLLSVGAGSDTGLPPEQFNKIGGGLESRFPSNCRNGIVRGDKKLFCHLQTVCGYVLMQGLTGLAFQCLA